MALEASEFWGAVCEAQLPMEYISSLREFMPQARAILFSLSCAVMILTNRRCAFRASARFKHVVWW